MFKYARNLMDISALKAFFILIAIIFTSESTFANKAESTEQILNIAAKLIQDGSYADADEILESVPEKDRSKHRFLTLSGLNYLYQERFDKALKAFDSSIQAGNPDRYLYIYKGQSLYGLSKFQAAITSFQKAGNLAFEIPSIIMVKAKAYWQLGLRKKAWSVIDDGISRYPNDFRFPFMQVGYLLELNLFQQAFDRISDLVAVNESKRDLLRFPQILAKYGEIDEAIRILEALNLKFPNDERILSSLAYGYAQDEQILVAATIFEDLARNHQRYFYQAAEMYRRAERFEYALNLNERVIDQKEKFKQRLAIYIAKGDFDRASRCERDLLRLGLLEQEELRYALAYAYFRAGSYKRAEKHLSYISESDLFNKSLRLRKEIMKCLDRDFTCTT